MSIQHDSRYGEFYSAWAYDADSENISKCNADVYKRLRDVCAEASQSEGSDDCMTVYRECPCSYSRRNFQVVQNPNDLSMEEIALVADGGSLCFGFRFIGSMICIYTD